MEFVNGAPPVKLNRKARRRLAKKNGVPTFTQTLHQHWAEQRAAKYKAEQAKLEQSAIYQSAVAMSEASLEAAHEAMFGSKETV